MKYNLRAVRRLIAEGFSDGELTTFCHDYFGEVIEYFGSGMSKNDKVLQLVTYCDRREELESLLEKVQAERPKKYEKYEAQLEGGEDAPSILEEIRAEASEYAEVFGPVGRAELHRERVSTERDVAQETGHPLAGDPQEIKTWFLKELDPEEQVFVVTAALFSGLERQELIDLYSGVLSVLRPGEVQTDEEA